MVNGVGKADDFHGLFFQGGSFHAGMEIAVSPEHAGFIPQSGRDELLQGISSAFHHQRLYLPLEQFPEDLRE